ncbi:MAG TPA: hypothetical protein VFU30_13645 [Gaiellaceae bacterium]|nr:hypothetical protein [Gaiellaceae bacterium]
MKRYVFIAAAALSLALGFAGGAWAGGNPSTAPTLIPSPIAITTSLIPSFVPLGDWLRGLRVSHTPTTAAAHAPAPAPRRESAAHAKPASSHAHAPTRQPRPAQHLQGTTLSIYEHSAKPWILAAQGCSAAHRGETGVVILDFGMPAFRHHGYGTLLFSGRFVKNHKITTAMVGYARGYVSCLPAGSTASISLARGTSNYHPAVPSAYTAGVHWARATNRLGRILHSKGLDAHVEAAAADDAEPAWDPQFHKTKQFFHGFRTAVHGHTLYDYGSLDGGVGAIWSARQAWYVAGGLRNTQAIPEIYNSAMAQQWAELARIAHGRYHRDVHFAAVMTQGTRACDCGLRPSAAHRVLSHALDAQGVGGAVLPRLGTNITG